MTYFEIQMKPFYFNSGNKNGFNVNNPELSRYYEGIFFFFFYWLIVNESTKTLLFLSFDFLLRHFTLCMCILFSVECAVLTINFFYLQTFRLQYHWRKLQNLVFSSEIKAFTPDRAGCHRKLPWTIWTKLAH